jgi:ABC-type phosphate/phosphonate transport system substrate-binding protein
VNWEAEIGATKNTLCEQFAHENSRNRKELVIVAALDVMPQNCLTALRDLAPDLKQRIRKILIERNKDTTGSGALRRFGARGCIETNNLDFEYVVKLSKPVGIDLNTYRFANN